MPPCEPDGQGGDREGRKKLEGSPTAVFWHRLAGHLGATVRELKERISWAEFVEWMAFDFHHGLDDVRLERQLALIATAFSPASARLKTADFRPYYHKPQQTIEQQRDEMKKAKRE